jgi:hypothetical protein
VSSVSSLEDALVSSPSPRVFGDAPAFWERLKKKAGLIRGYSDCYGHVLVATGRAEVMLDPVMNVWDNAALLPILEEAGGSLTDWSGRRTIDGGSAISTNGVLRDAVPALEGEGARFENAAIKLAHDQLAIDRLKSDSSSGSPFAMGQESPSRCHTSTRGSFEIPARTP